MRLVALVESEEHVCFRYRLKAFRASFARAGHQLEFQSLPRGLFQRLKIGSQLAGFDAAIVQRKLLPEWTVSLLRRRVPRLIFDFDDAVWLRDSYSPRGFVDSKRAGRFQSIVRASDLTIAGNDYLAAEAGRYSSRERICVIPTCVEPTAYPPSQHPDRGIVRLVWIGSESTLRGLDRFAGVLTAIGRAIPGIRLKLICDRFLRFPDLAVEDCSWREETEAEEIATADIGISWVPDDPWSRGKCGLKILQYQASGLPVVANPVGVHGDMVREGETGFLASTPEEWIAAVKRLAGDRSLRNRLGAEGRRRVETHYSVRAGTERWLTALERMAGIAQLRKSG